MFSPRGAADGARASRGFTAACLAIAALLVLLCVWIARREYFFGDDFIFLRAAREPRDWLQVFLPLRTRAWWSYRPLSIEVFFSLLYHRVGFAPLAYLLASITLHFATGALTYRLARTLLIERRVALAASVLSVGLYPTLAGELFWVSAFQTVSGTFFYVLSLTLFAEFTTGRGRVFRVAAAVAMLLALGCNELAMTLPGPAVLLALHGSAGEPRPSGRGGRSALVARFSGALAASAPLIAILLVYLPFRYLLIAPSSFPTPALNLPHLGWHIVRNVVVLLNMLLKGSPLLEGLVLLVVAAAWLHVARAGGGEVGLLGRRVVLLGGWLLCSMVPFLGAFFVPHRAAIVMQAPFCLLLAAHLDPLVRAATGVRAARLAELAMLGSIALALPYAALAAQISAPRGTVNRELLALLAQEDEPLPFRGCVRIVTRPEDQWSEGELYALAFRTSGVLAVTYPGLHLELPSGPARSTAWRTDCSRILELELRHGPPGAQPSFHLQAAERRGQ